MGWVPIDVERVGETWVRKTQHLPTNIRINTRQNLQDIQVIEECIEDNEGVKKIKCGKESWVWG